MNVTRTLAPILAIPLAVACAGPFATMSPADAPRLRTSAPEAAGFAADLPARVDSLVRAELEAGLAPGISVAIGRYGRLVHLAGYGRIDTPPDAPPVHPDSTMFDLASLTKVVATTTAAMILEDEGLLDLDRPVREYLPEFDDPAKSTITPRMLLVHTGGLEAFAALYEEHRGREEYLRAINERPLRATPGESMVYSDWDFILLQLIIERLTGMPLDVFAEERIFGPLQMTETGFRPDPSLRSRVAATEVQEWRGGKVHGEVHDENAWAIGGVAGHAGLFSTARDLATFAQMMLNGGAYGDVRVVRAPTVARWTARQEPTSSRALGWDTPSRRSSAGRYFSPRSFGHTGFTGTSIWMDPQRGVFVVLLTNAVNPTRGGRGAGSLRRALADLVQEAVTDAPLILWEAQP